LSAAPLRRDSLGGVTETTGLTLRERLVRGALGCVGGAVVMPLVFLAFAPTMRDSITMLVAAMVGTVVGAVFGALLEDEEWDRLFDREDAA